MITALSNNFGAGEIQLMDFQKDGLVVLNGAFEFDPANAAYLAAQVLEIKVSRLMINKSTNAVVYLVDIGNQMPHATAKRSPVLQLRPHIVKYINIFKEEKQNTFC